MKRMSSAEIWKAAPPAIRQQTQRTSTTQSTSGLDPNWKNSTTSQQQSSHIEEQEASSAGGTSSMYSQNQRHRDRRPSLDITVETTHSPLTKATNGNTTRASTFSDLEASVARQQVEFKKLSDRLTLIDENAKRANEAYHKMGKPANTT
jgi:rubrerythrin